MARRKELYPDASRVYYWAKPVVLDFRNLNRPNDVSLSGVHLLGVDRDSRYTQRQHVFYGGWFVFLGVPEVRANAGPYSLAGGQQIIFRRERFCPSTQPGPTEFVACGSMPRSRGGYGANGYYLPWRNAVIGGLYNVTAQRVEEAAWPQPYVNTPLPPPEHLEFFETHLLPRAMAALNEVQRRFYRDEDPGRRAMVGSSDVLRLQ